MGRLFEIVGQYRIVVVGRILGVGPEIGDGLVGTESVEQASEPLIDFAVPDALIDGEEFVVAGGLFDFEHDDLLSD